MNFFRRAPDDWQTVVIPAMIGRSGDVVVQLRDVAAEFSAHRNARILIGFEPDDFALWLLIQVDYHLRRAQVESDGRSSWCGACKSPLADEPIGQQKWIFEAAPSSFPAFEVEISAPGAFCEACGRANFLARLHGPAQPGDLLSPDILAALNRAREQIEF